MELRFLGTSSGTPTKTRNVTALAVKRRQSRDWYLVDCGEGTQHQLLRTPLSVQSLRGIFITHVHGDHCYGLPGLLASAGLFGRTEPLLLAGPRAIEGYVDAVRRHTDLHLPYAIDFRAVDEAPPHGTVWSDAAFEVSAHPLSHRVPSFAYAFTETPGEPPLDVAALEARGVPRGPLWSQLRRGEAVHAPSGELLDPRDFLRPAPPPRRIVVGGDNDTPALLHDACRSAQVLVHEATYTEAALAKAGPLPQHASAERVARAATLAGLPNLVLTHFSARFADDTTRSPSIADIEAEARAAYAGRLFLARDFDVFTLDADGVLTAG